MASYTRGRRRDKTVFVRCNTAPLFYGFRTIDLSAIPGVTAGDITALGHLTTLSAGALACFGANAPKPPRVTKRIANASSSAQASVSTFCSDSALGAAVAAGWSMGKSGRSAGVRGGNTRTITALVPMGAGGLMYAFPMNKADFDTHAAELGLVSGATITTVAEANRVVSGCSLPRPGRAMKELTIGRISTFYAPAKQGDLQAPTSGWRVMSVAQELVVPTTPPAP